jgi:hypothetical protein
MATTLPLQLRNGGPNSEHRTGNGDDNKEDDDVYDVGDDDCVKLYRGLTVMVGVIFVLTTLFAWTRFPFLQMTQLKVARVQVPAERRDRRRCRRQCRHIAGRREVVPRVTRHPCLHVEATR